jgi:hypothetical protein
MMAFNVLVGIVPLRRPLEARNLALSLLFGYDESEWTDPVPDILTREDRVTKIPETRNGDGFERVRAPDGCLP